MLSTHLTWDMASTRWPSDLNPIIALPQLHGTFLLNINLVANIPLVINTLLGRTQQGWIITDISTSATVWRTQPFNKTTLTLQATADTTVNLWVY